MARQRRRGEGIRYLFDQALARPFRWIGLLLVVPFTVIGLVTVLVMVTEPRPITLLTTGDVAWDVLLRMLDAGTMANDRVQQGPRFAMLMLIATVLGVSFVGIFTGMVATGVHDALERARRGGSTVVERGHIVILGWSPHLVAVLNGLSAHSNGKPPRIAILTDRPRQDVQNQILAGAPASVAQRTICRSGNLHDPDALEIVRPQAAAAVIVLDPDGAIPAERHVQRTVRTLTQRLTAPLAKDKPIIAELRDSGQLSAMHDAVSDVAVLMFADDVIARVIARASREPGWSVVFCQLLGQGDSIMTVCDAGRRTFADALFAYDDATVVGRWTTSFTDIPPRHQQVDEEAPGERTDRFVAVVRRARATNSSQRCGSEGPSVVNPGKMTLIRSGSTTSMTRPERTLIVGWNRRAPLIVKALDAVVAPSSELTVLTRENERLPLAELTTKNLRMSAIACESYAARFANLDVLSYHQVILLPDLDASDTRKEDAMTVDSLLALRRATQGVEGGLKVLAEMIDPQKADLIDLKGDEEIVVGRRVTSLLLARLAEDNRLAAAFNALLVGEGRITFCPIADYVPVGVAVPFASVVASAWQRGEIALGYKLARFSELQRQIHINPRKSSIVVYEPNDKILVVTPT